MITDEEYKGASELCERFKKFVDRLDGKTYEEDIYNVNFYKLPYIVFDMEHKTLTKENVDTLNFFISELNKNKCFTKIKRTKSGGITNEKDVLHSQPFQYDILSSTSKHIITLISPKVSFKLFIGFVNEKSNKEKQEGRTPSRRLINAIEKTGIDFSKYENSKEEGALSAKSIHKPEVRIVEAELHKTYKYNIHHLDFHKFYPSGIVILHPELKPAFEYLKHKKDKEALDIGTRFLASKYAGFKYATLVKDGINYMYERFFEVARDIKESGRTILAYNTDGIWYTGAVYHGRYEGEGFGEWSNDYIDVQQIRFASEGLGKYEFITKDGIYCPKFKGLSTYEREKPRLDWDWGDIYKGSSIRIAFNYAENKFEIDGVY